MTHEVRIILTRQKERNRSWADILTNAGLAVMELPLIRFENLALPEPAPLEDPDWILFSSPQAVLVFQTRGMKPGRARIGALGRGTAAALRSGGVPVDFDPGLKDGAAFASAFAAQFTAPASILLPGPARRMPEPVAILTKAGFLVHELPLYRTVPVAASELPGDPFTPEDVVFFCSPSTVKAFCGVWDSRPACVAIGETTAATARDAGFAPRVANTPDLKAMVLAAGLDLDTLNLNPESTS